MGQKSKCYMNKLKRIGKRIQFSKTENNKQPKFCCYGNTKSRVQSMIIPNDCQIKFKKSQKVCHYINTILTVGGAVSAAATLNVYNFLPWNFVSVWVVFFTFKKCF